MSELTTSQSRALSEMRQLLASDDIRPTYVLTGPGGSGKTTIARQLGGDYHNFALEWLDEFFATRSPLFLQTSALVAFLLNKVAESPAPLVVLDGLESALVGLVPVRRQEIAGIIQSLLRQSTGRKLVMVISCAAGSPFLTPGFADGWPERAKIVSLEFTEQDALEAAQILGAMTFLAEEASSFYDFFLPAGKE